MVANSNGQETNQECPYCCHVRRPHPSPVNENLRKKTPIMHVSQQLYLVFCLFNDLEPPLFIFQNNFNRDYRRDLIFDGESSSSSCFLSLSIPIMFMSVTSLTWLVCLQRFKYGGYTSRKLLSAKSNFGEFGEFDLNSSKLAVAKIKHFACAPIGSSSHQNLISSRQNKLIYQHSQSFALNV